MENFRDIKIEKYNYTLPEHRIAKFPLEKRDASKLLLYEAGEIKETVFSDLSAWIDSGSLMVFNNTKVIQARLLFTKETGANIEIFCLEPDTPADYALAFQAKKSCVWKCMIGNLKKWKSGTLEKKIQWEGNELIFSAERILQEGTMYAVRFSWNDEHITFAEILDKTGVLPIPPYLNRETVSNDLETYQTVYSKIKGSVAAPTAGLHFTGNVFDSLRKKGVECEEVTLHVGAGTFRPVKSELISGHEMHTEIIVVSREAVENIKRKTGNIVAVGTTSVRTLETLYYAGLYLNEFPDAQEKDLFVSQWQPYRVNEEIEAEKALENILAYMDRNNLDQLSLGTQIMIVPGYTFKLVNAIITNFHQPQSTLLLLISAFVGEDWIKIYEYALANDFRFLSYGDSSLLKK